MDPWTVCHSDVTVPENIVITKFEDNFIPEINDKLPDHEEYLAILESKLRKLKSDPNVLGQLAAKREACMQQLLSEQPECTLEQLSLDEPVPHSQILRTILPQKQALNQGEIVELIKYDQLSSESSESDDRSMSEVSPLLFLLKLAWDCRYRLPLLITVGFMVLDVRMQLDINVQMRQIPRPRRQHRPPPDNESHETQNSAEDNTSDSSWTTFEEQEISDED